MKQFIDLLPVIAFVGVYMVGDIYMATIALMAVVAAQVAFFKLKRWQVTTQMWVVFWGALGFGALTLVFRDPLFIQWKPTIVYWLVATAIAGSRFVGKGDYVRRALGKLLTLPPRAWRALSWAWASALALAGVANLIVAYEFSESIWVAYKFASAFAIPLLLTLGSFGYLAASNQLPQATSADGRASASSAPAGTNEPRNEA